MRGFKVFDPDWTCLNFQYEIGKTYELPDGQEPIICKRGFHFCENLIDTLGYYLTHHNILFAEVEAIGTIIQQGTKFVTNKIKIIREITEEEFKRQVENGKINVGRANSGNFNSGDYNSGNLNSGGCNSGSCNSGYFNSGYRNSGWDNIGDYNSGDGNLGNYNSGDINSGNSNSGCNNSGDFNSGEFNSGNSNSGYNNSGGFNSGNHNSGDFNSGNHNSGNHNTGQFNSGDYNSGLFNTNAPKMRMFNKETDMTYEEWFYTRTYNVTLFCKRIAEKNLEDGDWQRIKALPNFDAEIFEQITGLREDCEEQN